MSVAISLIALFFGNVPTKSTKADSGSPLLFPTETIGSSTCGQFAASNIVFGPSSSSVSSATGTTAWTITIGTTNVTTTAASATTTALSLANTLLPLIPSSTLKISVSTSTNGNTVQINMTSTVWGAFVNVSATSQLGITLTANTGYPATQVIAFNGIRNYFDITDTSATGTYVGQLSTLTVGTGHYMQTAGDFSMNGSPMFTGPIGCIGSASSSNATVSYTTN